MVGGLSVLPLVFLQLYLAPTSAAEKPTPSAKSVQLAEASPDSRLLVQIKTRVFDARASFFVDVRIDVVRGDVLLTGTVRDMAEKARAAALVRSVPEVLSVINELHIAEGADLAEIARDLSVENRIRRTLRKTFSAELPHIRCRVTDGIAYVFGAAATEYERNKSLAIVTQTSGVTRVINHLRIVPPATG